MGVLVQRKHSRAMRFALLPIALLCAYRAGSTLDFSFGVLNYRYLNQGLVVSVQNNSSVVGS